MKFSQLSDARLMRDLPMGGKSVVDVEQSATTLKSVPPPASAEDRSRSSSLNPISFSLSSGLAVL